MLKLFENWDHVFSPLNASDLGLLCFKNKKRLKKLGS